MKYGVISLVLCISTRLRLVTILSLLVKYLVIFHADPCNKSYIYIIYIIICLWTKKSLNRTLAIDSPFQTFTVGLLVKFFICCSPFRNILDRRVANQYAGFISGKMLEVKPSAI